MVTPRRQGGLPQSACAPILPVGMTVTRQSVQGTPSRPMPRPTANLEYLDAHPWWRDDDPYLQEVEQRLDDFHQEKAWLVQRHTFSYMALFGRNSGEHRGAIKSLFLVSAGCTSGGDGHWRHSSLGVSLPRAAVLHRSVDGTASCHRGRLSRNSSELCMYIRRPSPSSARLLVPCATAGGGSVPRY